MTFFKRSLARIGDIRFIDVSILLGLVILSITIIVIYISSERFFYYWDWVGYQAMAIYYASNIVSYPLQTLIEIYHSINIEYNHFYTVPLLPLILLFGKTRLGYVLAVTLVYQLPYALVIGGIATRLTPVRPRLVFWLTTLLVLVTPAAWAPTLRAYPDVGAALLIGLAILIYLQDLYLRKWWQILIIGFLIGAAILFRRHYAYGAIAFFGAIFIQALIRFVPVFRKNRRQAWRDLWDIGIRIGLVGATALLTLFLFGKPFLIKILSTNYWALFSSYELSYQVILNYYAANYGWIALTLAILGFALGWMKGLLSRPVALFLLLFGGISIIQWTFAVSQYGVHYTLHFTLPVVLGLAAFSGVIWSSTKGVWRLSIVGGVIVFVVANLVISLAPVRINPKLEPWVAYRYPPLTRPDYNEIVELVSFLRAADLNGTPIYVVDSSFRMNFDLLIKAEQALYTDPKFNVFLTPQIDSRDFYPLEQLLNAGIVIVSTPAQYHLGNPEGQKVVAVVHQAFKDNWKIAQDFTRLPEQFSLIDHVTLNIYRRTGPTSLETAVQTFAAMRDFIGLRPLGQPDWIILNPWIFSPISENGENIWVTKLDLNQPGFVSGYSLLFADPAPASGRLRGTWEFLENPCPGSTLGVKILDATGQTVLDKEIGISSTEQQIPFELEFQGQGENYLVFSINSGLNGTGSSCPVQLEWTLTK